jgi:two-component system, NtrC family, sensor histidine kinase HydH
MIMSAKQKTLWLSFLPWAILGSLAVLAPIMFLVAYGGITQEKENMSRLLVEKGAALIRSFEAGARAGMMDMGWGGRQVQRLLMETARQPDILYLVITDDNGMILAHSDPSHIGEKLDRVLPPVSPENSKQVRSHIRSESSGSVFEVYRQFMPLPGGMSGHGPLGLERRGMGWGHEPETGAPQGGGGPNCLEERDWCSSYGNLRENRDGATHFIFVGLDMKAVESAAAQATHRTLIMSIALLLVGFAGLISLFLAQGYKVTKRSLARVQDFSDQVVGNMPMGLAASDETGRIAVFNEAAAAILGKTDHTILGEEASSILPPELWKITSRLDKEGEILEEDIECSAGQSACLPLQVSGAALRGEGGRFSGYVLIFRDLTEVRRLQQEVERSRRLASVGSLAAGVAHEIRNPLSSIKGFATYFKERYKNHAQDRETAEVMIQEVERMDRVIGQLLEFARPSTLNIRPHSVPELIRHSLKLIQEDARAKGVEIHTQVPPEMPLIRMDGDRMAQVLLNLYLNGLQATNTGGILDVGVTLNHDANQIKITVKDNGEGIDPANKEHIFDPYFTTKSNGTGLGLAIVHKILDAHAGRIEVESTPGKGTSISIFLPIQVEDHAHA